MADFTPKKRSHIVTLSEQCNYTQKAIAKIAGVSQNSVLRIIKQQKTTGFVSPWCKGKCGRKPNTNQGQ